MPDPVGLVIERRVGEQGDWTGGETVGGRLVLSTRHMHAHRPADDRVWSTVYRVRVLSFPLALSALRSY